MDGVKAAQAAFLIPLLPLDCLVLARQGKCAIQRRLMAACAGAWKADDYKSSASVINL
jgi:hypothetical protein